VSKGARFFLGSIAVLLGAMMIFIAPEDENRLVFYGFGAFCISIGITCFTSGRVRAFFGSVVGMCVVVAGLSYLGWELASGPLVSSSRSTPSVLNAVLFNLVFGIPAATYVWRARFGIRADAT
jgi:uncharacterized membrane protein